jgi:hypothetical protein
MSQYDDELQAGQVRFDYLVRERVFSFPQDPD